MCLRERLKKNSYVTLKNSVPLTPVLNYSIVSQLKAAPCQFPLLVVNLKDYCLSCQDVFVQLIAARQYLFINKFSGWN